MIFCVFFTQIPLTSPIGYVWQSVGYPNELSNELYQLKAEIFYKNSCRNQFNIVEIYDFVSFPFT